MTDEKFLKLAIEFDPDPPTCRSCIYVKARRLKDVPGIKSRLGRIERYCGKFGFKTRLHAICNHWQDSHGETLEDDRLPSAKTQRNDPGAGKELIDR